MRRVVGVPASEGIGIAKVFLLSQPVIDINTVRQRVSSGQEEELSSFLRAVESVRARLLASAERTKELLSEEEAAIFEAQAQMCEDPLFVDRIKERLSTGENATIATHTIGGEIAAEFLAIEGDYFKARAADINEITTKICYELEGIETKDYSSLDEEVIVVANDITPSETVNLNLKFVKGFVTEVGGRTSHTAIVARSLGVPAVLGIKDVLKFVKEGDYIAIDGQEGEVFINPDKEKLDSLRGKAERIRQREESYRRVIDRPSISKDGFKLELAVNIGSVNEVRLASGLNYDAIGLVRSEFLYMSADHWPTEDEQFLAYKEILEGAKGKKVIIRTLDIGGDKELSYHEFPKELNPFLGNRAIRLSRANPEILTTQLRALIRASKFGKLGIMLPMISTLAEFDDAKALFNECCLSLTREGVVNSDTCSKIEVGMMVETPAAAVLTDRFSEGSDFFSIGSNDLIQYSMAADRMNEAVSYLYQPLNPSIIRFIDMTIRNAHLNDSWVGMCGEMGSDPLAFILLVGLGIDEISMSPSVFLRNKVILSELEVSRLREEIPKILASKHESEVREILSKYLKF